MKKLLAPVDFSEGALAALEHAAALAKALHASTLLLHVVPALSEWELQAMDLRLIGGSAEIERKRLQAVTKQRRTYCATILPGRRKKFTKQWAPAGTRPFPCLNPS